MKEEIEALVQITMCARHKCEICYYGERFTHQDCDDLISENLRIIREALQERKKGHNLSDHPDRFECSVCGFEDWDCYTADVIPYNYCPHCGAKMEEGDTEDGEMDQE